MSVIARCPKFSGFGILPVGMVSVIALLNTTWLCFQNFPLLYAGRECYAEDSTMSNNANLCQLLTTAVMVDNLVEKVGKCPLIGVVKYKLFAYNWESVIRSSGMSPNQGLKDSRDFQNCPLYHGC